MTQERDHFLPSIENALHARNAIHSRLNESLRHIFKQCEGKVDFDSARATILIRRTETNEKLPPALFGFYFFLIDAVENGTLTDVQEALEKILTHANDTAPNLYVRPFNRNGFSVTEEEELRRQFISESLLDEQISHLAESSERDTLIQFQRALDILEQHAPITFSEIKILSCELIPAYGSEFNGTIFDGCSSLERWGAILVNAKQPRSDLELSEVITHEYAHNALFAMAPVNFHVENDPDELYKSPLRLDPRPINGIYHATFVLARMYFAMYEVATSATASSELREEAWKLAENSKKLFADGYSILQKHAIYTVEGRDIMQDTYRYMTSHALRKSV